MGLFELQSLVCGNEPRAVCLRVASGDELFPATSATSRSTVPRTFRSGFILSCLCSPSKLLRRASLGRSPCGGLSCLGFFPHRGVTEGVHSRASVPALATFRPQVFSTSRRLSPPCRFAGLFHPAATSRAFPFRGLFPSRRGLDSSPRPCPRAVGVRPLTEQYPVIADRAVPGCHERVPRLRGFAPRSDAYPEPAFYTCPEPLPSSVSPPSGSRAATVSPVPRTIRS